MRGNLLGPLIRRVHRVRPADRIVIVCLRSAELVDLGLEKVGRLDACNSVQHEQLVEAAVRRSFGRRSVVADDVVDQRVVELSEPVEPVDEPPDVIVGMLEEAGIHFHLPREYRLHVVGLFVPRRDLVRAVGQLGIGRNDAELLLPRKGFLAQRIPALVELSFIFVGPLFGNVMWCVRRTGREIHEKRLVGHQRLLLRDPLHRLIRHVDGKVIVWIVRRFDRNRIAVNRGRPLVGLATDKAVEMFETAAGRPLVERSHRAGLPRRHFVTLAELRGRVSIEFENFGKW